MRRATRRRRVRGRQGVAEGSADVTIWGTCYRYASTAEPCSPGSNQSYIYGIPDLAYE